MNGRIPPATVGILGAGQLGLMTILAGRPLGFRFVVLADAADDPATTVADEVIVGSRYDRGDLERVAAVTDLLTYEIEHIDAAALTELEAGGAAIRPSPRLLAVIQDKLAQKRALDAAGVPVPAFAELGASIAGRAADDGRGAPPPVLIPPAGFSYPFVQKLRRGGYDGRGVAVLRSAADEPLSGDSYVEELIELECELSILVARSPTGETVVYPAASMEFDERANICSAVTMPADLETRLAARAAEVAIAAVEALDVAAGGEAAIGIFAIELFLAADGRVLVNEIAPRPHNSGHLTFESCTTSQFEQHLRAISGLPLGAVALISHATMLNLLGDEAANGPPAFPGYDQILKIPGAHIHWYEKREVRPFRKMGHLTVTAENHERLRHAVERARHLTAVTAARVAGGEV